MSEIIQSISQGTYTIGQTSATNFQAGPGISITQPSEGVVRIANDETVLFSSTGTSLNAGGYLTINESPLNFEYVRIDFAHQEAWGGKHSTVIPNFIDTTRNNFTLGETWFRDTNGYNNMWRNLSNERFESATNRIYHISGFQGVVTNTAWNTNGELPITYYKVIGINRISGGNE